MLSVTDYIKETGSTYALLSDLLEEGESLSSAQYKLQEGDIILPDGKITTKYIKFLEEDLAKKAVHHAFCNKKNQTFYPPSFLDYFIDKFEEKEGGKIKLDVWQREAVYVAMNNNLFILTGGPGTGKTCVLKCIHYVLTCLKDRNYVRFTAPTGKAARRITESVNQPACTLHKEMKLYDKYSKPMPIKTWLDSVIVDEISMLDTITAHHLFDAIGDNTKLILVGDVEQLPSVGCGSVLRDLIDGGLPSVKLEKTFRQASESGLFANIIEIKSGLHLGFVERDDFSVIRPNRGKEKESIINAFISEVKNYGLENVVCLTPYRKVGSTCAIKMNEALQAKLNPKKKGEYVEKDVVEEDGFKYHISFRLNDPVMQLENTSTVANGDVGVICEVKGLSICVKFIDYKIWYNYKDLDQLCLAYAMSVHKSQGSEYKSVITSALPSEMGMLNRNTIYTAVTRAKQKCTVVTNGNTAKEACSIEAGYERKTRLRDEIFKAIREYNFISSFEDFVTNKQNI